MSKRRGTGSLVLFFLGSILLLGGRVNAEVGEEFIKRSGGIYYERVEVLTQKKGNNTTETKKIRGENDDNVESLMSNGIGLRIYTKKYKVPFLSKIIKDEIKGLLHSDKAVVIFHNNGEMEVRDDRVGQKRIADYIKEVKKAWLSEWKYRIEIIEWKKSRSFFSSGKKRGKKIKDMVYEGIVLPLVEGRVGYAGRIAVIPQAGMYMFNVVLPEWGIQETFIVKGDSDSEDFIRGNIEVKVFLKRINK